MLHQCQISQFYLSVIRKYYFPISFVYINFILLFIILQFFIYQESTWGSPQTATRKRRVLEIGFWVRFELFWVVGTVRKQRTPFFDYRVKLSLNWGPFGSVWDRLSRFKSIWVEYTCRGLPPSQNEAASFFHFSRKLHTLRQEITVKRECGNWNLSGNYGHFCSPFVEADDRKQPNFLECLDILKH
jgi:hypothetical protein